MVNPIVEKNGFAI